jgi:hypothetical protein
VSSTTGGHARSLWLARQVVEDEQEDAVEDAGSVREEDLSGRGGRLHRPSEVGGARVKGTGARQGRVERRAGELGSEQVRVGARR